MSTVGSLSTLKEIPISKSTINNRQNLVNLKKESFLEPRLFFITSFRTIVVSFVFMSYIVVTAFTLDATHIDSEMRLLLE